VKPQPQWKEGDIAQFFPPLFNNPIPCTITEVDPLWIVNVIVYHELPRKPERFLTRWLNRYLEPFVPRIVFVEDDEDTFDTINPLTENL